MLSTTSTGLNGKVVLMPVCSPAYAEQMGLLEAPERLAACLLLHDVESIPQSDPRSEWRGWLTAAGIVPKRSASPVSSRSSR